MDADRRSLIVRGAVVLALLLAGAVLLKWLLRSDWQKLSDAIDDASDALVEERDEDFLAFFTEDVVYRKGSDRAALERDLARWHQIGVVRLFVLDREIKVHDGDADITLVVAAGQGLLQMAPIDVELDAVKGDDGIWRVRSFGWKRR